MLKQVPAVLTAILMTGSLVAGEPTESVVFKDPAKDVYVADSNPDPSDIVKVEISSDGKFINFAFTLAAEAKPLDDRQSGIAAVGIDTDNDPSTGPNFYAGSPEGMEVYAEIHASVETDGGASKSGFAAVGMIGQDYAITGENAERIKANGLVYSGMIPYETVGVSSGQVVRISVKEVNDYGEGEGFFPEAVLKLK